MNTETDWCLSPSWRLRRGLHHATNCEEHSIRDLERGWSNLNEDGDLGAGFWALCISDIKIRSFLKLPDGPNLLL
jgi:hypothetical protein